MAGKFRLLGLLSCALLLAACQQATAVPRTSPIETPVIGSPPLASPSAMPSASVAPTLSILNVGAVATPSGFTAFALIGNPSNQTAKNVGVQVTSLSSTGQVLAHRSGKIAAIPPGTQDALAVDFPLGRTLPSQFKADVIGVDWSAAHGSNQVEIAGADFLQDARTPTVRVHLLDHAAGPVRVNLTTVCLDASGNIRGGGSRTIAVSPSAGGQDAFIAVSLSAIPARCNGYGIALG